MMNFGTFGQRMALMALVVWLQACSVVPSSPAPNDLVRNTPWGPVRGTHDGAASGTLSWKGVPFAQAPVGDRRWRAPVDPTPWTNVRDATRFAAACKQTGRLYGPGTNNRYDATIGSTLGQPLGDEDCLFLNIWHPGASSSRPRPVIVWVYGGSNITGYTADPVYDGAQLARTANAIVVSVNYRVGIFGFLDLPALKTGHPADDSGNYALLDIVKALEFVQAGIAAFGGDPDNVTLMGESAGAVNVYALLTSPMLQSRPRALFHRLVALSGGISTQASLPPGALAVVQPRRVLEARGRALLEAMVQADGHATDSAAAQRILTSKSAATWAAYLRNTDADRLLDAVKTRLAPRGLAAAGVVPDGHVVATDPIAAIRAGRYTRVPVLAGITRDEGRLFPGFLALRPDLGGVSGRLLDDAQVFALTYRYRPDDPPATRIEDWIPPAYLPVDAPGTGFHARTERLNQLWFTALRDDVLGALRAQQPEVWCYRFDWDELPAPFDAIYGAAHSFDLPFIFGNFGPSLYANISFTRANAPGRSALSAAMMASLAAFAAKGDPNHPALEGAWPAWPGLQIFDASQDALRLSTTRVQSMR